MIPRKVVIVLLSALAWLAVVPSPVGAEWFADLFVGPAFTQSENVVVSQAGFKSRLKDVDFDNSVSFGGRGGYWFESTPYFGLALDVSHFRPDIGKQKATGCFSGAAAGALGIIGCFPGTQVFHIDLGVTGISFDALLRWPLLTSKDFPKGQIQPYLTLGPTIFVAQAKDSRFPLSNFIPGSQSETDTSVGVKVGAGIAWQFHQNIALFGEYRFTHFAPKFDTHNLSATDFVSIVSSPTKTDIDTHRVIFGVSLRFW